ncbi:MAG: hypothetical protein NTZ90_07575 [Proteobacteria bacterium]|nr:hypothetical protein [Pseudomonadota bacterium]
MTTKERVLQARGQEVPLDYFLYSCLERERLEKATIGDSQPHIAWPLLPKVGEEGPVAALEGPEWSALTKSLLTWYRETFPELSDDKAVDHEHLLKVVPPVVGLARDLARLYLEKTKAKLPAFDKSAQPEAVWSDIESALKQFFPKIQHMILRYLHWTHAAEVKEVFEPGSRPPVGRFAPPPLPRTLGNRDSGRPDRGGRPERGPRTDAPRAPVAQETSESKGREAAPKGGNRHGQGGRPAPADRGGRPPRREGGRPPRSAHPEGEEQTARLTVVALAEVDQAIAELQSNGTKQDITLKPTNSFYRRLQHQKIVDAGFNSNSVGEGPDRAVQISRKDP